MVLTTVRRLRIAGFVALAVVPACLGASGHSDGTTDLQDGADDTTASHPATSSTTSDSGDGSEPDASESSSGEDGSTGTVSSSTSSDATDTGSTSETGTPSGTSSSEETSSTTTSPESSGSDEDSTSGDESTSSADASGDESSGSGPCERPRTLKEAGACIGLRKGGAGIHIGAAVARHWLESEVAYRELLLREFDSLTPENEAKWDVLQPSRDTWYFEPADALVDFAQSEALTVRGHTLVWHSQRPYWIDAIQDAEDMRAAMRAHITATLDHFRGRVPRWDVVNEAFADGIEWNGTWLRDWRATQLLGSGYIAEAFQMAREVDPDIDLFYNDYNNDGRGGKADQIYAMVEDLVEQGVPIDGVGFQLHINATPTQITPGGQFWSSLYPNFYNVDAFADNIDRYAALGLKVHITEMDVRVRSPFHHPDHAPDGTSRNSTPITATEARLQANIYYDYVSACVEKYPACDAITFWGVADQYSWYAPDPALPFDATYAPKAAYDAIMAALEEVPYIAPQ